MKTLVAYFSAESGRTAGVAKKMAAAIGADLFEIRPVKPYSAADLNYMNPIARCNREFMGKKQVPVAGKVDHFDEYELVLIGFPIWYGCAILFAKGMTGAARRWGFLRLPAAAVWAKQ